LGHKFPPEWQKKVEQAFTPIIEKGRDEYPTKVRFVTCTLKYSSCAWVEILGLERHYRQARVEAERNETGFIIKTGNIRGLHLTLPEGSAGDQKVQIDGQELTARPWLNASSTLNVYLERVQGKWKAVLPQKIMTARLRHRQKVPGLQGPIDDAFSESFVCVRGTGTAWHESTGKYAEANLERFRAEWSKYLRGDLPIKDDIHVTNEDIAGKHLIVFGDPASNSLLAQVVDALPLEWSKDKIAFGGQTYSAAEHVPVLIYPNPLNAERYLVLNSGHTFHAADFQATNARLYPRLGDYAILKPASTDKDPPAADVVTAGIFDDFWKVK